MKATLDWKGNKDSGRQLRRKVRFGDIDLDIDRIERLLDNFQLQILAVDTNAMAALLDTAP
jgi:hypothetical protein